MSAPAKDRELSHPAARAIHTILTVLGMLWDDDTDFLEAIGLLEGVSVDVAALYQSHDEVLANNARLLALNIHLERDLRGLRDQGIVDAREITELKSRLARAAEENEAVYKLTNHEVGDATARHLSSARMRDLLDLETPLPARQGNGYASHFTGAPRAAATH